MKMTDPTVEQDPVKMANPVEKIPSLCRRVVQQQQASHFLALMPVGLYIVGVAVTMERAIRRCTLDAQLIKELVLKVYVTWAACGDEHSIVVGYMMNSDTIKVIWWLCCRSKWDERLGMGDKYPRTKLSRSYLQTE